MKYRHAMPYDPRAASRQARAANADWRAVAQLAEWAEKADRAMDIATLVLCLFIAATAIGTLLLSAV